MVTSLLVTETKKQLFFVYLFVYVFFFFLSFYPVEVLRIYVLHGLCTARLFWFF